MSKLEMALSVLLGSMALIFYSSECACILFRLSGALL